VSSIENTTALSGETSAAFKRRFMTRLIAVLIGGMFLDGYILGIIGPVTGEMTVDLRNLGVSASMLIAAVGARLSQWLAPETKGKSLTETAAGYSH
jgi:putative MFS transporter